MFVGFKAKYVPLEPSLFCFVSIPKITDKKKMFTTHFVFALFLECPKLTQTKLFILLIEQHSMSVTF